METVLGILLVIAALVMIIAILMQQSRQQGLGSIGGGAETFFGKAKARGMDARLALITKISATAFIILSLIMVIVG
ncbi:MAG: preprotein translocase subunit SecG [Christensenellaceae bacterium]|nr:preprotein translocase subunit SecG [Christensenellaceae bacterium]